MYLKRKTDACLENWMSDRNRKPLIIRGARQIGKTESILTAVCLYPCLTKRQMMISVPINTASKFIPSHIFEHSFWSAIWQIFRTWNLMIKNYCNQTSNFFELIARKWNKKHDKKSCSHGIKNICVSHNILPWLLIRLENLYHNIMGVFLYKDLVSPGYLLIVNLSKIKKRHRHNIDAYIKFHADIRSKSRLKQESA